MIRIRQLTSTWRLSSMLLPSLIWGCADYSMQDEASLSGSTMSPNGYRTIRIDVTPSNASDNLVAADSILLPQSFWIDDQIDWMDIDIQMANSTHVSGNISGYTIYPYVDIVVPGEQVPVEAQIQIQLPNSLNGSVVNSDANGNFELFIPSGSDYQMSVSPLSPQNVPYLVLEDMRFASEPSPMQIDLGVGYPIYGRILEFDNSRLATAQLIDTHTGIKGPQVDVSENGYFQLRAPELRSDLTVRIQGTGNSVFPTVDIPIRVGENDTDGFRLDVELGDMDVSTVFGRIVNLSQIAYGERCTIRFESQELQHSNGHIVVETNNDLNGNFTVHLLEGSYKMMVIPPYSDSNLVSPISMDVSVDELHMGLGDIPLPEPLSITGTVTDLNGLPSVNTSIQFKDVNYNQTVYSTNTDETGRFLIKVPPVLMNTSIIPNTTTASIQNFETDFRIEGQSFDWTLQKGQPLSGVVSFDGNAVSFALIEVFQGTEKLATGLTGGNGEFEFQIQVEE